MRDKETVFRATVQTTSSKSRPDKSLARKYKSKLALHQAEARFKEIQEAHATSEEPVLTGEAL